MARMWLWNSLPTRCRSMSDVFLDSGMAILQTHMRQFGHQLHCEDWAKGAFFESVSPGWLTRLLAGMYRRILTSSPLVARLLGTLTLLPQWLLTRIQRARMERRLEQLAEEFVASGTKVLGVKVWYGEAYTWSKRLVERVLGKDPSVLVLAGGYHATLYEEELLRDSRYDLAVVSEGEFALKEILDVVDLHANDWDKRAVLAEIIRRAERGELPNVVYRKQGRLCRSARQPYHTCQKVLPDYRSQEGKVPYHVVVESTGCAWGKCSFCVHKVFNGRYRPRPVADVIAELRAMARQGIALFRLAESDVPAARGAKLARAILDAGLRVEYVMGHRAARNARARRDELVEQYCLMISSGLRAVFMGGETGNDWVNQHVMNKGLCRDDLVETIKAIQEARRVTGIHCDVILSMIYPVPTLGKVPLEEVFEDNLSLIREARPDVVQPNPPAPIRGAKWFEEAEHYGFRLGADFLPSMMEYEYCLCKPTSMWPSLGLSLDGRDFHQIMAECDRFRRAAEAEGLATNLSDVHCAMARLSGYEGREGLMRFKKENFVALASCDYRFFADVWARTTRHSRELAAATRIVTPPAARTAWGCARPEHHEAEVESDRGVSLALQGSAFTRT